MQRSEAAAKLTIENGQLTTDNEKPKECGEPLRQACTGRVTQLADIAA